MDPEYIERLVEDALDVDPDWRLDDFEWKAAQDAAYHSSLRTVTAALCSA